MMSWEDIKLLRRKGWIIGSHSQTHPVLSRLSRDVVEKELVESRSEIEHALGEKIDYLAYPYGIASAVSSETVALAKKAGYRAAFMNTIGKIDLMTNPMEISRCKVLGTDSLFVFKASLNGRMDLWGKVEGFNKGSKW